MTEGGKISRGNSTDYCSRITEFQRKTKANSITLLLNKKKLNKPFLGYVSPIIVEPI